MLRYLLRNSPDYSKGNFEGWSVILVVAVGFMASTFANTWLGMVGLFAAGILCAHVIACVIKYFIKKASST